MVFLNILVYSYLIKIIYTQNDKNVSSIMNTQNNTNLSSFIKEIELELKKRANILESQYIKRCTNTCPKSYRTCSSLLPEFECSQLYNSTSCDCYVPVGSKINFQKSIVAVANEPTSLTKDQVELICITETIDPYFVETRKKFPQIRWQYVGTQNGLMRFYPAQDDCDYDPRAKNWYIAGANGSKNVLVLLDISGSMEEHKKFKNAIDSIKGVVDTLSISDWVGLIYFSSNAKSDFNNLIRATKANRKIMLEKLDNLTAGGKTNFELAFNKSYSVLENSKGDDLGPTSCETIILFITDGLPTEGETNTTKIGEFISLLESEKKINATIITYALGANVFPDDLKPISCAGKGLIEYVEFTENLMDRMMNYYNLLSTGSTNSKVIWTEPYEDESGLGNMTSAIIPFYARVTTDPPLLLGVLGIDLTMAELYKYDSADTILKHLVSQNKECSKFSLSFCQLESLRGKYNCVDPKISNCSAKDHTFPTCENILLQNPFYKGTETRTDHTIDYCCGVDQCKLEKNILLISFAGSIVFGLILIIAICYLRIWIKNYVSKKYETGSEIQAVIVHIDDKRN